MQLRDKCVVYIINQEQGLVCVCVCVFCVHNNYKQNRKSKGCRELCVHLCVCVYIKQSKGDVCVCMCGE